jgi:LacI family transcriptional regulator, repressor for deo operon, udp, cdd, tsx, nupC, and nupG
MRRTTIRDVADLAGVSTATVSRALGTPAAVGEATRARVLEAVRATGYRVNRAARDLRRTRAGAVLVLVPNLANPFFSAILAAIADVCAEAGLTVQVADTVRGDARLANLAHDGRADGVILLDGAQPPALLQGLGLPLVTACEWVPGLETTGCRIDNAAAARLAVRHLRDLGHRRLAHVAGPEGNVLSAARIEGFREAADGGVILPGDFGLESGVAAARQWLTLPDRPTGVFCASDAMALGFISECAAQGVRVPEDVSVVGFDDIELAQRSIPPLTTVHQPRAEIGRRAAMQLVALFDGGPGTGMETLPVELAVRGSTTPPR